jgi:hypothetical protein
MLLTTGYLADFKTGYLQIAVVEHRCEVTGGTDDADADGAGSGLTAGYAAGRVVKLVRHTDGSCHLVAPADLTDPLADGTHIVAQTDDSLDTTTIRGEVLDFRPTELLKNTATSAPSAATAASSTVKRVALYKIVNTDDIKLIPVAHATTSVVR